MLYQKASMSRPTFSLQLVSSALHELRISICPEMKLEEMDGDL